MWAREGLPSGLEPMLTYYAEERESPLQPLAHRGRGRLCRKHFPAFLPFKKTTAN